MDIYHEVLKFGWLAVSQGQDCLSVEEWTCIGHCCGRTANDLNRRKLNIITEALEYHRNPVATASTTDLSENRRPWQIDSVMPQMRATISFELVAALHTRLKMPQTLSMRNMQEAQDMIGRHETCRLFCLWSP